MKTVHQRIMEASRKGRGVRLSANEVFALSKDDAIETRAHRDDVLEEDLKNGKG